MTSQTVKPFLKWVGGKGQLVDKIINLMPKDFNNYVEPFVGGGALFFALHSKGILSGKTVTLSDYNEELINTYSCLQKKYGPSRIAELLSDKKYSNSSETFYSIRAANPTNNYERAARMIYLNKTCFNGLYRVNGSGKFNTPFGKYTNPTICDLENLKRVCSALFGVNLLCGDFEGVSDSVNNNDLIYFDPPYQPVSTTSNFTGYTKNSFGEDSQKRLANFYESLNKRGCKLMLSNSDAPLILELYKNFNINIVKAKRSINCDAKKRGEINEVIITNY